MRTIESACKYRIYPNKQQKEIIAKTFGSCRFVYNKYLAMRIDKYEELKESFAKCFGCVRFIYNRMLSDKIDYYKGDI